MTKYTLYPANVLADYAKDYGVPFHYHTYMTGPNNREENVAIFGWHEASFMLADDGEKVQIVIFETEPNAQDSFVATWGSWYNHMHRLLVWLQVTGQARGLKE